MRLAVLQARAGVGAVPENLARLDRALAEAAAAGADLLVSPELFATGYAMDALDSAGPTADPAGAGAGAGDGAAPAGSGEGSAAVALAGEVAALSARHAVAHVWSQPLHGSIAALVADATGTVLGAYAKVHLFGEHERAAFTPGQGPPLVVGVAGMSVGVVLCYDVEFPETARAAALAGAQVLAVPTAMDDARVASVLLPARALENGLVLAYANHPADADAGSADPAGSGAGAPGTGAFCGQSVVLGADGSVLACAQGTGEALLVVDVDPAALAAARAANPYLQALRTEAYRSWASTRPAAPPAPPSPPAGGAVAR